MTKQTVKPPAKRQGLFEKAQGSSQLRQAAKELAKERVVRLGGVWGSSPALIAAAIGKLTGRPILFVAGHMDDADDVADDIEVLTGSPAMLLPAWEVDIGTEHVNDEIAGERLRLCNALTQGGTAETSVIVASVMALLQPVPTATALAGSRLALRKGQTRGPQDLIAWLVDGGYEHVDQVDQQGEFAHRGGIVDVFAPGAAQAARFEFFGDRIESIRLFDLDTQRSTDELDGYDIMSASAGRGGPRLEMTNFADYLPGETIVCMVNPAELDALARQLHDRQAETVGADSSARPSDALLGLADPEEVLGALERFSQVRMHTFIPAGSDRAVNLGIRSLERLSINASEAMDELGELADVCDVWVYCENPAERQRFEELLAGSHPKLSGRARLALGHLHAGFHWPAAGLVAVGHHEIFHRYAKVRRLRRVRAGRPIETLLDLREGDYVVHVGHGIARFEGLRVLQRDGQSEEYLTLRFADRARLHVPASQIHLVQKYIGAHRMRPSLSKLGGATWARQKNRVAEAVRDLAADMLKIQATRNVAPGVAYPLASDWQRQFTEEFVYTETEDQLVSMTQIGQDMAASRPMDRLLCGDVGYGKTELAMRAAFKTAEAGKQVAVLVPTTVLADQHHRTFSERFADYPFSIEVLSRFRKPAEQRDVLKRLAAGQVDILIGTHRILSDDVKFRDLGLVVIDEEQRFGVEHKERLKSMRATVDVLTMTATPIPRTLHMALLGIRDISALATAPLDRRAIHTEVCHHDERLIRQVILRELNRQGQVFFVHNRVMDIDALARRLRALAPEARVAVAHGQMPGRQLEETMLDVVNQRVDVLLCTTIIESGLDIPTANTMVIHEADRFGLAELHQLRGRVGRYKHRAYCYLLLPQTRPVSAEAAKRLKTIEEFSDLGAGFQIAMRDLEIRGAGNILGPQQSGHIAAVGYELYCQLLERSVGELRGEPVAALAEVHVELGVDCYIPRAYVPSDRQRMEIYRRMARCRSPEDLGQLQADLADAYGQIPPNVQTLLDLAEIRVLAASAGIDSIVRMDPDIVFTVRDFSEARDVFEGAAGTVRLP
ncbi:MAG TPA: transcription-repair coupling factor, partial [Phycisphaerae bacterium]|nr:transcription-repair coupling factor [Phycisphaerae bacterium]